MVKFKRKEAYYSGILLILAVFIIPGICFCQNSSDEFKQSNRGAQYYLGSEDELLIKVNVWGFVRKPGQYLVPSDTDLISLLSFVGGPLEEANIKNVKLIRSGKGEKKVIRIDVKKYLKNGNEKLIPGLLPGDTIVVTASKMYYVNKFFDTAAKLAIIIQMAWYFTLLSKD